MIVAGTRFDWGLNGIDYLLILEGLVMLVAGIFWAIGEGLGKNNPDDTLCRTMRRFWREVLRPTAAPAMASIEEDTNDVEHELDRLAAKQQKKVEASTPGAVAVINVKVVPGSSRNQIAGKLGEDIKVQVTAPPEGGEANKAVIDLLAEVLEIQAYRIKLVRGHYQPRKSLQVAGLTSEQVEAKLAKFL